MLSTRFETIKSIAVKRTPTTKPMLVNPTVKNPKHAQVLADSGINYDSPLTPSNVSLSRKVSVIKNNFNLIPHS